MKSIRLMVACGMFFSAFIFVAGCAKRSTRKISVEGPENKYELKLEKSEKNPD